jgi:F-type H+-transporting ATPase subunit b
MRLHSTRIRGKIANVLLGSVLTALIVPCVLDPSTLLAQEKQPKAEPAKPKPSESQPAGKAGANQEPLERQVEKELEQGSETDAQRNSPLVVWIAKHTGLSRNAAYWLCVVLNFAIVFFSIVLILRKMLPVKFRNRTALIQQRLEEARKTSEEARRRLSEVEGRLSRLDVEITGMRREADENAREDEKRVQAGVTEERRRIVESAEQEITMAANAARRELTAYAGELAVALAEKRIKVAKDTDQSLVREFTASLGKDGQ